MTLRPGLAAPRIMRGNTAMMRALRPSFPGMYLLNDDTGNIHQWTGEQWESVAGNGTPEKADILKEFQRNVLARQSFAAISASGSGSSPGIRVPGQDPSITDPTIFTAPPVPSGLPHFGGMDVPILRNGGGDKRSATKMPDSQDTDGPAVFDTFERTVVGSWGSVSPSGLFTWAQTLGGAQKSAGVNNGSGFMSVGGAGGSGFVIETIQSVSAPWDNAVGFDLHELFMIDTVPGVGKDDLLEHALSANNLAPFNTLDLNISSAAARGKVVIASGANIQTVVKTDWTANAVWNIRWEHRPGVVSRAKVWPYPSGEPLAWLVSVVGVAGVDDRLDVQHANNGGGIATAIVVRILDMQFSA